MMLGRKLHWLRGMDGGAGGIGTPVTAASRPSDLRRLADDARAAGLWWLDAHYRRALCAREGARAGDWLQYGHALKESGRFADAADAYRHAGQLAPDDAEIPLQLGHLSKVAGLLVEAGNHYRRAAAMGADTAPVDRELDLLAEIIQRPAEGLVPRDPDQDVHVFLSSAQPLFDEGSSTGLAGLGGRDYSYAFAMRNFAAALESLDIDFTILTNPEYMPGGKALIGDDRAVHLGFYPPERIRLLKGAYNVVCFAWEFERLRSPQESASYHAFADQATMLALADELWVPSSQAAAVVRSAVTKPVHHVPAPVALDPQRRGRTGRPRWRDIKRPLGVLKNVVWQPLAVVPRLQSTMNAMASARQSTLAAAVTGMPGERPPTLFATVMNVHDFRKQLRPMLEGFIELSRDRDDALLLIKLTTPDRGKLTINEFIAMDQLTDPARLIPPMVSERILITDEFLTAAELSALYDVASFYCCTSYAEGQNLPLLEAMGRGVVPVSVDVTAMADYVDEGNGVVIASMPTPADHRLTDRYGMTDFLVAHVNPDDVAVALRRACDMGDGEYAQRSTMAARTIQEQFGTEALRAAIDRLSAASTRDAEIGS